MGKVFKLNRFSLLFKTEFMDALPKMIRVSAISVLIYSFCMIMGWWLFDYKLDLRNDFQEITSEVSKGVYIAKMLLAGVICFFVYIKSPSSLYGHLNNRWKGVTYALLPVSSLEKFISMLLMLFFVYPTLISVCFGVADVIVNLFTGGPFIYNLEYLPMMFNGEIFPSTAYTAGLGNMLGYQIISTIMYGMIFIYSNLFFKKNKVINPILILGGIWILSASVVTGVFIDYAMENEFSSNTIINWSSDAMIYAGLIIPTIIVLLLGFLSYRKIRTLPS